MVFKMPLQNSIMSCKPRRLNVSHADTHSCYGDFLFYLQCAEMCATLIPAIFCYSNLRCLAQDIQNEVAVSEASDHFLHSPQKII